MTDISYSHIAKKKRTVRLALVSVAVAATVAVIAFQPEQSSTTATSANTLSISGPWEITSLEPSKQGYVLTRMEIVETLLNVTDQGVIIPGLATDWQVSPDGLVWTLTIKKGVRFHDDSPMTVEAVAKSLEYSHKKHGALSKAKISSIDRLDDSQIQITLSQPYSAFAALLTNYSTAILSPASFLSDGDVEEVFGTGPYQVDAFEPPHKLTVKKFDGYWGAVAKIPFASYLTGHRAESRILQAKSGEADLVYSLDPAMMNQLDGVASVEVQSHLIPRTMMIKLNHANEFLVDLQARRALSMAIDRHSIAKNVLHTDGSETTQMLPESMSQWFLSDAPKNEYDLEKAAALLAGLGWEMGDDNVLTKEGQPFEMTMITYADRAEMTPVATAIQAQWAKLGVRLNVEITNSSAIPAQHKDGSLETALITRNFGFITDPLPIIRSDFAFGGGDWGAMNWQNEQVDAAVMSLIESRDTQYNQETSQEIASILHAEYPVLPISSYTQHVSINQRIQNFKFDPFERDYHISEMEIVQ